MSLRTVSDLQTELLVRNNRTTTDSFITDTMLNDWVRQSQAWATGLLKWPFTEARYSTTFASLITDGDTGYLRGEYPEGWRSDSIRLLTVGGKRVQKTNFYRFQSFMEDNNSNTEDIYTDFGRSYYINPNTDLTGTIAMWGQMTPTIDPTDKTAETVFSGGEEQGNEALVLKMTSYLKAREHLIDEANNFDQMATQKLQELNIPIQDEKYGYQSTQDDGMFKRLDVLGGGLREDTIKRDQFS